MKENKDSEARRKFVNAFNTTMIRIWREKIVKLGAIDTGKLYRTQLAAKNIMNADASQFELEQQFPTYGLFVNWGTGREVYRGNPGDIGRAKIRQPKRWFDIKYYASVMNTKEFMAESMSMEYLAMMTNALSDRQLRQSITQE